MMRIVTTSVFILLFSLLFSQEIKPIDIKKERHETIIIKKKTILGDIPKTVIDTTITVDTITIKPITAKEKKYWKKGGNFGVNVTQTGFKNWVSGGEDAFSGITILNLFANYKKSKVNWINILDIQYGLTNTKTTGTQKSTDILKLLSKCSWVIKKKLSFSTFATFNSQLTEGFNYPNDSVKISDFMAPGYINVGAGFEYIPSNYLTILFSPLTGKITFVQDDYLSSTGAFGITPGKTSFNEIGTSLKSNFKKEIMKNVNLQTSLNLFSSYNSNFGNVDIYWDLLLFFKVSKYINATITTGLIYDDDIHYTDENGNDLGPKIQLKEIIGVGFSYNFGDK